MRYTTVALLGCALLGRADNKPVLLNRDEIRFEGEGIKIPSLWRASDNSAADMLIRWPAGVFENGKKDLVSTHPFGFRIVVVEGTGLFHFDGGPLRELKPGAYLSAPRIRGTSSAARWAANSVCSSLLAAQRWSRRSDEQHSGAI
jgi:hypothetical protein